MQTGLNSYQQVLRSVLKVDSDEDVEFRRAKSRAGWSKPIRALAWGSTSVSLLTVTFWLRLRQWQAYCQI